MSDGFSRYLMLLLDHSGYLNAVLEKSVDDKSSTF
jgi:hypothetical protein